MRPEAKQHLLMRALKHGGAYERAGHSHIYIRKVRQMVAKEWVVSFVL